MAGPQASIQSLFSSPQFGERSSPAQVHPMGTQYGSFQTSTDYCQPETIDPALTLLSTTAKVFKGTEGVTSSRLDEGRHLAAGTADLLAEWWELGLQEYSCEGCPLEDSSGSMVHFPSQDDPDTTMAPPYQTSEIYYIHPEQQRQSGVPCLTNETGRNGGSTDVMSQQWGFIGPIADFTNDGLEEDAPTIMMPSDPFLLFYAEDLAESFERAQSNDGVPLVGSADSEVPRASDGREMTYVTEKQKVDSTGACGNTENRPQRQYSFIKDRNVHHATSKLEGKGSGTVFRNRNRINEGDAWFKIWELKYGS